MKNTVFKTIWSWREDSADLELLIEELKSIIKNNSVYWDFIIYIEDDELIVKATRYETDEEYKGRMKKQNKQEEQQKKIRYEEYLKLKKEFDIENKNNKEVEK